MRKISESKEQFKIHKSIGFPHKVHRLSNINDKATKIVAFAEKYFCCKLIPQKRLKDFAIIVI